MSLDKSQLHFDAMPTLNVNGQEIYYTENEIDTDAPAVILVHGAGSRLQVWPYSWSQTQFVRSTTVRRWLTDFPLYMLDLPGHGRSKPPGRKQIDAYAQVVLDFVAALGLNRFVIGGHSMGAAIAQTIGLQKPPGLLGLILFGAGARMPVTDLILDGLRTDFEKTVHMIVKFSWNKQAAESFTDVATQHMLATPAEIVHGDFVACNQFNLSDQLGKIEVPVLVVAGENDKMMPPQNGHFLAEHIPNAQLVTIPQAGHFMMTEKTNKVTREVVRFLNGL